MLPHELTLQGALVCGAYFLQLPHHLLACAMLCHLAVAGPGSLQNDWISFGPVLTEQ